MHFHGYFRSSSAYRCRIAFNLKNLEYNFTSVHLRRGGGEHKSREYRMMNPQSLVPALEYEGQVFTQSMAIIEWLDEKFPKPHLLPKNTDKRAHVRAFSQAIACEIHPLQNLRVLQYIRSDLGGNQEDTDKWCRHWIEEGLSACEALLRKQKKKNKFCFGDSPGMADICLVPQVFSAERFGADISKLTRIRSVYEACNDLPAFADAHPSRQTDSEK